MTIAVVLDDHALAALPGLDAALAEAGALVMRSFAGTPNPQLLRLHAGVGVVGGSDKPGLMARLERATTTLATVPAPVIGVLPPGVAATEDLLGPGVVDLLPAGVRGAAERILLMARVPVVTGARRAASSRLAPPARDVALVPAAGTTPAHPGAAAPPEQLVAIASSTGGVWVVGAMLRKLPQAGRAVVLAQHMDAEFMSSFAQWLGDVSGWRVLLVHDAVPIQSAAIHVPAGGMDLVVEGERVCALPSRSRFVPCADRLLASAATRGRSVVGVVLSGMGSDGAAGLASVVGAGGRGLCQDPDTAVVASMPVNALRAAPAARVARPEALAALVAASAA